MSFYKPKTSSLLAKPSSSPTIPVEDRDRVVGSGDITDTISELRWSPRANWLAASSWDGRVYIYDVANDLMAKGVGVIKAVADAPMLSCDWNPEGTVVAGASTDKQVYLCCASDGSTNSFVAHDAPVRSVRFIKTRSGPADVLATGSWDGTVRYWDLRNTTSPFVQLKTKERVYSMDTGGKMLVIATADRHIHIVDLQTEPAVFEKTTTNHPLNHQSTIVAVMPSGKGYAVGSIEGRVSLQMIQEMNKSRSFSFRCHRHETNKTPAPKFPSSTSNKPTMEIFTVNAVSFHPINEDVFATAGSDGGVIFWSASARQRVYTLPRRDGAISAAAFNSTGSIYAYAVGYDWSKGCNGHSPTYPRKLMLHSVDKNKVARK